MAYLEERQSVDEASTLNRQASLRFREWKSLIRFFNERGRELVNQVMSVSYRERDPIVDQIRLNTRAQRDLLFEMNNDLGLALNDIESIMDLNMNIRNGEITVSFNRSNDSSTQINIHSDGRNWDKLETNYRPHGNEDGPLMHFIQTDSRGNRYEDDEEPLPGKSWWERALDRFYEIRTTRRGRRR